MRSTVLYMLVASLATLLAACTPDIPSNADGVGGVVAAIADSGAADNAAGAPAYVGAPSSSRDTVVSSDSVTRTASPELRLSMSGSAGSGEYRLFDLDAGIVGDAWTVTASADWGTSFVLALFDSQKNLVRRELVVGGGVLNHILRADSDHFYLGICPSSGTAGGAFSLVALRSPTTSFPVPRQQVVWLNFAGASGVRVHGKLPISFEPFDGSLLGDAYGEATAEIKQTILREMQEDFAAYNVVIHSSDDGPPPAGTYATLQFGGDDPRLLGLADSVDQYDADLGQTAVIYVGAFAAFAVMNLDTQEMSQMIANTASHELGHLLGLFHTKAPTQLMDTTGTAWDLVADQRFSLAPLEPSVFPIGAEDAPALLLETVGPNPDPAAAKPMNAAKRLQRERIRAIIEAELPTRCGTCLDPDH